MNLNGRNFPLEEIKCGEFDFSKIKEIFHRVSNYRKVNTQSVKRLSTFSDGEKGY